MFLSVDGGRSRISGTTSQRARRRHFLPLMVGAPDLQYRLPGGLSSTFFALMVDTSESPAPPPRGLVFDVS
jgi:hypothetical protein